MKSPAVRSFALLAAVGAGWLTAGRLGLSDVDESAAYEFFITALLGFGLYASTSGIEIAEFRKQFRTVVLAVTLGVLAKVAVIFGVMYLVFRDPSQLILAVAVAQIDPLSVAAMRAKSRLSDSAKALLSAWASFDDPITVLLTVYFTAFALHSRGGSPVLIGASLSSFVLNIAFNLVLAGGAFALWRLGKRFGPHWEAHGSVVRFAVRTALVLVVLTVGFLAVRYSLLLALAIIGLFFRPRLGRSLDGLAEVAMFTGTFAVGLVLVEGVSPVQGAVLGVGAFLAQAVVATVLTTPKVWRGDRMRLALGQQNGLTAIILALLLEPDFPGTIAIVAPAIVVVNLLNAVSNGFYDRFSGPKPARTVSPRLPGLPAKRPVEPAG